MRSVLEATRLLLCSCRQFVLESGGDLVGRVAQTERFVYRSPHQCAQCLLPKAGPLAFVRGAGHEGAAPPLRGDYPSALQFQVGPRNGVVVDPQVYGQLPDGG